MGIARILVLTILILKELQELMWMGGIKHYQEATLIKNLNV